jgi:hypothetical protein
VAYGAQESGVQRRRLYQVQEGMARVGAGNHHLGRYHVAICQHHPRRPAVFHQDAADGRFGMDGGAGLLRHGRQRFRHFAHAAIDKRSAGQPALLVPQQVVKQVKGCAS